MFGSAILSQQYDRSIFAEANTSGQPIPSRYLYEMELNENIGVSLLLQQQLCNWFDCAVVVVVVSAGSEMPGSDRQDEVTNGCLIIMFIFGAIK